MATRALRAGQTVFKEQPLIIVPLSHRSSTFFHNTHELELFSAFEEQKQSIKDAILDLYSPTEGVFADALRARYSSAGAEEDAVELDHESIELMVKVSCSLLVISSG